MLRNAGCHDRAASILIRKRNLSVLRGKYGAVGFDRAVQPALKNETGKTDRNSNRILRWGVALRNE